MCKFGLRPPNGSVGATAPRVFCRPRPEAYGQQRIYRRLRLIGEGPAKFFFDACELMDEPDARSSTSLLVGHLMREVESAVRAVLEPEVVPDGVSRHRRRILGVLEGLGLAEDHPVSRLWLGLPGDDGLQGR